MKTIVITRIAAIIVAHLVFWYLIYSSPDNKGFVIGMYVFFGTLQLILVVPKIIRDLKKKGS